MSLQNILMNMLRKLRDWHRRKIAVYHLSELEGHRLRDIGIARRDIIAAVNGGHAVENEEISYRHNTHRSTEDRLVFGPAALTTN